MGLTKVVHLSNLQDFARKLMKMFSVSVLSRWVKNSHFLRMIKNVFLNVALKKLKGNTGLDRKSAHPLLFNTRK